MKNRTGLTRVDLAVAVACVAFVLANVPVIIAGGRGRAKLEVCLANLRALTAAWQIYADDNAGKLVNGAPQLKNTYCPGCPISVAYFCKAKAITNDPQNDQYNELPWIGGAWGQNLQAPPAPECCQRCAVDTGALWKYVQDYDIYRCPAGQQGALVTYMIVDSMNGLRAFRCQSCPNQKAPADVWYKNRNQIKKPASRIVFIDVSKLTPDSYAVYYDRQDWFDIPQVRHGDGTCVSYADGHTTRWIYKGKGTIEAGREGRWPVVFTAEADYQDLYKMQLACWGKLGYTPKYTPDPNW